MVNRIRNDGGWLSMEMAIGLAILVTAVIPLAFSFVQEQRVCRAYYYRAVAMEIVDGEMEILAAGEWRAFKPGRQPYRVQGHAAQNLPDGELTLTIDGQRLRLEWQAIDARHGGPVIREAMGR